MIGTFVNTGAIIAGGAAGMLFGRLLGKKQQETLMMACGVGTLFIGIAGAMRYMLHSDRSESCWILKACLSGSASG